SNNVDVVYPHLLLCDDRTCHYQKAGKPLYLDNNHLTAVGAKELAALYPAVFSFGSGGAMQHASK
ncbi:MAG TPA: SGNH hydrolase domain-containing protein, partial [Hyphomicrobium sp.]|nr:SGNH hydrolase domain-containing protein [Hyphomicrobium sp.]